MIFNVELLAFGNPNEIRNVEVPDNLLTGTENDLELIFNYGQNDVQIKNHPSVSAGDIINYNDKKFVVAGIGFKLMSQEEYKQYLAMSQLDRHMLAFHYG